MRIKKSTKASRGCGVTSYDEPPSACPPAAARQQRRRDDHADSKVKITMCQLLWG